MKTKNSYLSYIYLLLTAAMMFTINSCKKDTLVESPTSIGPYNTLLDFYSKNGVPIQTFTINPTIFNTITGSQGTVFSISANTLLDITNTPPAGNVTVQLIEIYTKKDIVLSNKTTTSFGQILKPAGEFYINFVANGIQYQPTKMKVDMPNSASVVGIQVYYGNVDNITGEVNWVDNTPPIVTNDNFGYHFSLSNSVPYSWVNCSFITNVLPQTNITISTQVLQTGTSETVTMNLFLVFKTITSAVGAYNPTAPNTYTFYNIPIGKQASVVGIGVGKLTKKPYFGMISATTVVASQSLTLTLTQSSEDQIKTELGNL